MQSPYLIADRPGFSPQISRLTVMMDYARRTTLQMVQGLTVAELDFLPDPTGNSIGMLLEHFVAVEIGYAAMTFDNNKDWYSALGERWRAGGDLGDLGREKIKGHGLLYYLENLETTRAKTYAEFAKRDDTWLEEPIPFWGTTGNRYFAWFHVFEDEINHRGQIRLLHKQLPRFANRGVLGLHTASVTPEGRGFKVTEVVPNSAGDKAGLQAGDVVLEYDGLDTRDIWYMTIPIVNSVGVTSMFKVQRGAEILEFAVTRVKPD
jgi:Protein of unknown function (DUF664)/PDZ domain